MSTTSPDLSSPAAAEPHWSSSSWASVLPVFGGGAAVSLLVFDAWFTAQVTDFQVDWADEGQRMLGFILLGTYACLGGVVGWLWLARARLRLARQLAEARRSALAAEQDRRLRLERLAALGQLAASIAHEVRNPLGVIKSSASLLEEDQAEGTGGQKAARFIREETDRLNGFVSGLLAFAREGPIRQEPVDLCELVDEARALLGDELRRRELTLRFDRPSSESTADGDAILLGRVVYGLLLNATQSSPEGGSIDVHIEPTEADLRLSVTDEGPGVPVELRERVFDPFFTTKKAGTGLGLAIARQIAEAHRGELALSEGNPGARFELRLPRSDLETGGPRG